MDLSGNSFRGITVSAQRAVIKKNRIDGIHGFSDWPSSHSFGIEVNGAGCEIRNNFIRDISPFREGDGVGISIDDNDLIEGAAEAKAEFEVACEQGLEEGCRQRDILAKGDSDEHPDPDDGIVDVPGDGPFVDALAGEDGYCCLPGSS
jgi:hypothetical protein